MKRHFTKVAVSALVLGSLSLASIGLGTLSAGAKAKAAAKPTVATWAEAPQTPPNYIFPFMGLEYFSVSTINQFQFLMYRPLYWFGKGASPDINLDRSTATAPVYSNGNKTVTINMKGWKWSNGETVSATDVMFWMNMLHGDKDNWADYTPDLGIPDDISNVTVNSDTQITFQLTGPVNPDWFTYNELSQISPMPLAWDVTALGAAAGSGGCARAAYGSADAACHKVFTFLSRQSGYDPDNPKKATGALKSYATNPIWHVVDGPWQLSKFNASGNVEFTANAKYSGPIKPSIKKFVEVPFTSDTAEYNALVNGKLDVGFVPSANITTGTTKATRTGPNSTRLAGKYSLAPVYGWGINYFPYNFGSTGNHGTAGKIFSQLYFRQAFQRLVDQSLYIKKISKGYGIPTYGPVPVYPQNKFTSASANKNPYAYSVNTARKILAEHGWKVIPNGQTSCMHPGTGPKNCGAGIPAGTKLTFTLEYPTGGASTAQLMNAEKSSWAQAGIDITLKSASFNTILGKAVPCEKGKACDWELENWGGGWIYAPDYYPTGEAIFATGSGSNSGSYNDPKNDALIKATTDSKISLNAYQMYLAKQLPVVWQPNTATALTEIRKGLKGVTPQSPLISITPEAWRF